MTEQEALMLAQAGIDGSGTLLIDADTRSIYVPESEKFFGVESDQNVERKKFKCPKIVGDNIDLSTLHLYINYQNGNGNKDSYMIQDMAVSGEYITFSWVLSRNVAAYKGTVRFIFCAKKADSSGNLVNEWNTTVAEGEVIEGLEATATIADNNPDIIEQMLTLLKNVSDEPVFTEARTRENVTNGDKVPVLWGKVKKWFADLGTAAFCKVVNNLTTAAEGGVLDARQGKELNDALTKLNKLMGNTDISGIGNGTVTNAISVLNSKALPRKIFTADNTETDILNWCEELLVKSTLEVYFVFASDLSDKPLSRKYRYSPGLFFHTYDTCVLMFYCYNTREIAIRSKYRNGEWNDWRVI